MRTESPTAGRSKTPEAIIHKSLLSASQLALLDGEPAEIPAWLSDCM